MLDVKMMCVDENILAGLIESSVPFKHFVSDNNVIGRLSDVQYKLGLRTSTKNYSQNNTNF